MSEDAVVQPWPLVEVISGGQTGADQAGLRAAQFYGYKTGGMMPKGWRTETGPRPEFAEIYGCRESAYTGYEHRTRWNILHASGTIIFADCYPTGKPIETGSALTYSIAHAARKPHTTVRVTRSLEFERDAQWIRDWIIACEIRVLNVAGNRESKLPNIGVCVEMFLREALKL